MQSVDQSSALDQAISAVDECVQHIGVLSITTMARYTNLLRALKGFGNLDDARYNFALESDLLADAHKQWKSAADALELLISQGVEVHPETGEHSVWPYVNGDGSMVHPGCACDGSKPVGFATTPFARVPFPEPSIRDYARGTTGCGDDEVPF